MRQAGAREQGKSCPGGFETPQTVSLQKVDVTSKAVAEVLARTIEYLQPNPGKGVSCEGSAPASSVSVSVGNCSEQEEAMERLTELKCPGVGRFQAWLDPGL